MPRKVRGPDGIIRLFPDDATDAEIATALEGIEKQPSLMAPKPSWGDVAVNAIPSVGGTVGGIAGGVLGNIPGAIGGAMAGGGIGEALRQLVDRFRGIEGGQSNDIDRSIAIGKEAGLQGLAEGIGAGASKFVIQPAAKAVMRGYLKPSLAGVKIDKAREIVQTALDEALPITAGGERRAGRLITDLNKQINGALQGVKGKVDPKTVADKVRAFAKAKYYKPGVSDADYQAALEVADSIDKHASMQLPNGARVTKVNATGANEIKQAVRPNSRAYGQRGSAPEAATRKVAGSEMRQAIEDTAKAEGVTDVGAKNAREGRIIDAQEAIKRAAGREENKGLNPTAVPNLIAGAFGGAEYARERDPASAIATSLAIRAALSPALMTRAAILASKIAKNGYTPAAAARIAIETVRSESEKEAKAHVQGP